VIILLRHAKAGDRERWDADDRERPLDGAGRQQARALVAPLSELGVRLVVSSPYVRCVQTVEPLAAELGLEVELEARLAEGSDSADVIALAREARTPALLCTHGDVIEEVLGGGLKKGAGVILELAGGELQRLGTIPAP
jgi:8-oxo-dGTP diphosphatase